MVEMDNQQGRYVYEHQADSQYGGNGYDHVGSQYGRYRYDHQAIINIVKMDVIIELIISMMDVGVIEQIMKNMGSIDS